MEFYNDTVRSIAHSLFHQRSCVVPVHEECGREAVEVRGKWYCRQCVQSFDWQPPTCPVCLPQNNP